MFFLVRAAEIGGMALFRVAKMVDESLPRISESMLLVTSGSFEDSSAPPTFVANSYSSAADSYSLAPTLIFRLAGMRKDFGVSITFESCFT